MSGCGSGYLPQYSFSHSLLAPKDYYATFRKQILRMLNLKMTFLLKYCLVFVFNKIKSMICVHNSKIFFDNSWGNFALSVFI